MHQPASKSLPAARTCAHAAKRGSDMAHIVVENLRKCLSRIDMIVDDEHIRAVLQFRQHVQPARQQQLGCRTKGER